MTLLVSCLQAKTTNLIPIANPSPNPHPDSPNPDSPNSPPNNYSRHNNYDNHHSNNTLHYTHSARNWVMGYLLGILLR